MNSSNVPKDMVVCGAWPTIHFKPGAGHDPEPEGAEDGVALRVQRFASEDAAFPLRRNLDNHFLLEGLFPHRLLGQLQIPAEMAELRE